MNININVNALRCVALLKAILFPFLSFPFLFFSVSPTIDEKIDIVPPVIRLRVRIRSFFRSKKESEMIFPPFRSFLRRSQYLRKY